MRDQALAICGEQGSDQREELKATSIETLRQMVAAGVGCTLLPQLAALPGAGSLHADTVLIRPFAQPLPTRTIGLAWRRNYPRESTVLMLAEWICDRLPQQVEKVAPTRGKTSSMGRVASSSKHLGALSLPRAECGAAGVQPPSAMTMASTTRPSSTSASPAFHGRTPA